MEDKNKKRRRLISYAVAIAIGLMLAFGIMCYRGLFEAEWERSEPVSGEVASGAEDPLLGNEILSDGFFVAAMIYLGIGALLYVSSTGTLDMLMYGLRSLVHVFLPRTLHRDKGGFYEYKMKKKENRKPVPFQMIWIGLAFLLLAILCVSV